MCGGRETASGPLRAAATCGGAAGVALLALNLFGVVAPPASLVGHPDTVPLFDRADFYPEGRSGRPDVVYAFDDATARLGRAAELSVPERIALVADVVNGTLAHDWDESLPFAPRFRVPWRKNWVLAAAAYLSARYFGAWQYYRPRDALRRGVGLCSQHTITLCGLLAEHGVDAFAVRLATRNESRHIVAEVVVDADADERWVVDADYGVIIPRPLAAVTADPSLAEEAYIAAGYRPEVAAGVASIFAAGHHVTAASPGAAGYSPVVAAVEVVAGFLKWAVPLGLIAVAGLLVRPASRGAAAETSPGPVGR